MLHFNCLIAVKRKLRLREMRSLLRTYNLKTWEEQAGSEPKTWAHYLDAASSNLALNSGWASVANMRENRHLNFSTS